MKKLLIAWLSLEVHDGRNIDHVPLNSINQPVWKTLNKVSPKSFLDLAPHERVFNDFGRSHINRVQKRAPNPG